jgi:hypothetical protein
MTSTCIHIKTIVRGEASKVNRNREDRPGGTLPVKTSCAKLKGGLDQGGGRPVADEELQQPNFTRFLESGRHLLEQAASQFNREIRPEEYWLFGVGLAALTLGNLNGQQYAVDRIDTLLEELGYQGVRGDWWGRFVAELAQVGSSGMLWPVFERNQAGQLEQTGCQIRPDFGGLDAYWLSLAHVAGALAQNKGDAALLGRLAALIVPLVDEGRTPAMEEELLGVFRTFHGSDHPPEAHP